MLTVQRLNIFILHPLVKESKMVHNYMEKLIKVNHKTKTKPKINHKIVPPLIFLPTKLKTLTQLIKIKLKITPVHKVKKILQINQMQTLIIP